MAKRRLTSRQKRQRTKKIRNRVILALAVLALTSAAMAPELRAYLNAKIRRGVQAFADLRAQDRKRVLPQIMPADPHRAGCRVHQTRHE